MVEGGKQMAKGKVLIVDDEALVRNTLVSILQDADYQVEQVANGSDGLTRAYEGQFDVVLVDIKLPDLDGMEVLRILREMDENLQVLIITGYPTLETAAQAIRMGAFDYLFKPLESERVVIGVQNALETRRLAIGNRQLLRDVQQANVELEKRVRERTVELEEANRALRIEITERKQVEETVARHRRDLQRLSAQLINAQEAERKRLSRELHDEMGQALTAININLAVVEKALPPELAPTIGGRLSETRSLTNQIAEQIGELSLDLRPAMLDDLGLLPTLRWYVDRYAKRLDIEVGFEAIDLGTRLSSEVETVIYRIVQEALTNIARHSQANRVHLRLERTESKVRILIEDNGQGFDVSKVVGDEGPGAGMGLLGMRERVATLKGSFNIQSRPGQGTQLTMHIPL